MSYLNGILKPEYSLGFCEAFDTKLKYYTIQVTKDFSDAVYLIAFILGLRNIWCIIIK